MNPVKVSVVLPIYNVEPYLNRCIESVVNQTYTNLEIILVDDGSPDNCPVICDEWTKKDNRIQAIHKENAGLGMARNTGIDYATGKYIFFFDTDDYVDATIVEKCVKKAQETNSDVVIYGRNDVYVDGRVIPNKIKTDKTIFHHDEIVNELLPGMFTYDMGFGVSAWGKMFNLETFKELNQRFVSEREIISEDAYFSLEFFSRIQTATVIRENLYFYLKRENSLSRTYRQDRLEKNNLFLNKMLAYAKENKLPNVVKNHFVARYHMYIIGAMKQICISSLSSSQRKMELRKIYKDQCFRKTLTIDVLRLFGASMKGLMIAVKLRLYSICDLLLKIKVGKS